LGRPRDLVVLMGLKNLRTIAAGLISGGRTPVAVISHAQPLTTNGDRGAEDTPTW
jgi:siroheme synthase